MYILVSAFILDILKNNFNSVKEKENEELNAHSHHHRVSNEPIETGIKVMSENNEELKVTLENSKGNKSKDLIILYVQYW
jgi:hypothetical protein